LVMSSESKDNPFVSAETCNQRHGKISLALFGQDGRGGMVKDVGDLKHIQREILKSLKHVEKQRQEEKTAKEKEQKEKKRDYRGFLYSLVGGLIVALASFALKFL